MDARTHYEALAAEAARKPGILAILDDDIASHERRIIDGALSLRSYDDVNKKREVRAVLEDVVDFIRNADSSCRDATERYAAHICRRCELLAIFEGGTP